MASYTAGPARQPAIPHKGPSTELLVQDVAGTWLLNTRVDICIITPLHPSLNPRVVKEADALTDAGYSVSIIAPEFSAWAREADKEFEERAWKVVERPRFGPLSPRVYRITELARRAAAGFGVRKLGIQSPAWVFAAWHPATPMLVTAAKKQPARLYIAHYPAALPAADIAAGLHDAQYGYDAEDFHPGDLPDLPEYAAENAMVRQIERRHLPGCAYVTAASPGIADAYAQEYGIARPVVILNTFPRSKAPESWSAAGTVSPAPSMYWFSQTIGGDRGLQAAVEAIGRSKSKPHLFLRGVPAPGVLDELTRLAGSIGVEDRLHILPMAPPDAMEALATQYDIGLCGEIGHTPNRCIALTNKQFTYILAGIPVLLSDIPAHRAFAAEAEGAVELFKTNDADSLAAAIDNILSSPGRLAAMREAAWRLGQQRFHWERDRATLVKRIQRVFHAGAPSELITVTGRNAGNK